MAYTITQLRAAAKKAIDADGVYRVTDLAAAIGVSRPTLYNYFHRYPKWEKEVDEMLFRARRKTIKSIRKQLLHSGNPTALIKLYQMICDPDERRALSVNEPKTARDSTDIFERFGLKVPKKKIEE